MDFAAKLKKLFLRLLLLLFGLLVAVVAAELFLRIWQPAAIHTSDKPLVSHQEEQAAQATLHKPGVEFTWVGHAGLVKEFTIPSRWNSYGFNDDEHSFEKPEGRYRIVILGDSYVEALEVPQERSFHRLLEKKLNDAVGFRKYEVIALGTAGNGSRRNYLMLETLGMKFRPDLVIMEFFPTNDIVDDSNDLRELRDAQIAKFRELSPLMDRPAIYRPQSDSSIAKSRLHLAVAQGMVNMRFRAFRRSLSLEQQIPVHYFVYAAQYPAVWKRAWKLTLNHIKKAQELASSGNSDFMLVYFNERFKLSTKQKELLFESYPAMNHFQWDFDQPIKVLEHFSKANSVRFLNLEPKFGEKYLADRIPLHYEFDGHWNAEGHKLAAEILFQSLQKITKDAKPFR